MNRIEQAMTRLQQQQHKAFITYMTAGMPTLKDSLEIIKAQAEAGVDVIELGIPFSDPVADGPVIQQSSYEAIQKGVNITKIFALMKELRRDCEIPIIFMLYYNTIVNFGLKDFINECITSGVDGIIVPDLPLEETFEIKPLLKDPNAPLLIPLVSPISGDRIPSILKEQRGFVYCVSSMGVTGQNVQAFHSHVKNYLQQVKGYSNIPLMMGFGIKEYTDIEPFVNTIDGCIVGSHFITLMRNSNYDLTVIKDYIRNFKKNLG